MGPLQIPGVAAGNENGVRRSFAAESSAVSSLYDAKHLPTPYLTTLSGNSGVQGAKPPARDIFLNAPTTPLFVKTHDFLLWLIRHSQRFPKNLRHSYTLKLKIVALEFQEAILMGNSVRGVARSQWLAQADGKLVCLRALLRLAYDLQLLAGTQVQHTAGLVDELGRLLGAWRKGEDRLIIRRRVKSQQRKPKASSSLKRAVARSRVAASFCQDRHHVLNEMRFPLAFNGAGIRPERRTNAERYRPTGCGLPACHYSTRRVLSSKSAYVYCKLD